MHVVEAFPAVLIYRSYAESILSHDPHIAAAIMFGNSRFQNGVLVDPNRNTNLISGRGEVG